VQPPQTRYVTRPDGVSIGYQVAGEGPLDLVVTPGFVSHLDLQWADPAYSAYLERLASFSRLIMYDKPGTGVSDPVTHLPTIEERAADIGHVLEAAGSERAALLGVSEGGPASVLYAATHPARVSALVLIGTFVNSQRAFEGLEEEALSAIGKVLDDWGNGDVLAEVFAPSATTSQRRLYGTFQRAAASPRMARAVIESMGQVDVTGALPALSAPTIVLHRTGDRAIPVKAGRDTAAGIEGARFVELSGEDHVPWYGDVDALLDEVESFLTGARPVRAPTRELATVLFTDIAGSTERAAALGDTAWRALLARHDELAAACVGEYGGRVVKSLGDGMLATFHGPAQAVRCARAICDQVGPLGIEVRAGLHAGEVENIGGDLGGLAVHIGARVSAMAAPGEVLVSSTVKDLVVGSELRFEDRGEHALKGVPGQWRVHAVTDAVDAADRGPALDSSDAHMTLGDRALVAMVRRAPRAMRTAARLSGRRR
jgi:class 3 adenylate cyclase